MENETAYFLFELLYIDMLVVAKHVLLLNLGT